MNRFDHQWQKLTALARQAHDERAAAPYGFATRVAAQAAQAAHAAHAPAPGRWAPFERFALRGLMVSAVFGVAAVAFDYSVITSEPTDTDAGADTIGELLDLS
jgi:hypothetical protein